MQVDIFLEVIHKIKTALDVVDAYKEDLIIAELDIHRSVLHLSQVISIGK